MKEFNKKDWNFERSSGYKGYRNVITEEWIYEAEYMKLSKENDGIIDIENLILNLKKLNKKFKEITENEVIKPYILYGNIFDGYDFNKEYVTYNTSSAGSSGQNSQYSLRFKWEDINKPISYFEEYFKSLKHLSLTTN
jgi:hypothetical protein